MLLTGLCVMAMVGHYVLPAGAVLAAANLPAAGQLSFARLVAVNDSNAVAGQTVFNGNRFKVAKQGTAIVNLGKMGRIELGAETDFVLRLSGNSIGGELKTGCMIISAPTGVDIALNTRQGLISSAGTEPAALSVGFKGNSTNVIPNLGEAKVAMGSKAESVKPGEVISMASDPKNGNSLIRRKASDCGPGVLCACSTGSLPNTAANAKSSAAPAASASAANGSTLLPLVFGAMMIGTAGIFFATFRDNVTGNNNTLTCVDSAGIFCRQVSPTSPLSPNN